MCSCRGYHQHTDETSKESIWQWRCCRRLWTNWYMYLYIYHLSANFILVVSPTLTTKYSKRKYAILFCHSMGKHMVDDLCHRIFAFSCFRTANTKMQKPERIKLVFSPTFCRVFVMAERQRETLGFVDCSIGFATIQIWFFLFYFIVIRCSDVKV